MVRRKRRKRQELGVNNVRDNTLKRPFGTVAEGSFRKGEKKNVNRGGKPARNTNIKERYPLGEKGGGSKSLMTPGPQSSQGGG